MSRTRLLILSTALCLLMAAPSPAAETQFKLATLFPENNDYVQKMRAGGNEIGRRTEGRVSFKFYTGGVMGDGNQLRRKMRVGQLHGGTFSSSELKHLQPDTAIYGLPMLFDSLDEVTYVRDRMDDRIRQRLEDAGFVNFGFTGSGLAHLMATQPIRSLADMSRIKVWIPEGDEFAYAASQALGIVPVTLPLTDVLTGLQTDLIDSVIGPPVAVIVMQWHTVVRHITDFPIAYPYAALVLDGRAFGKLSAADQAVVREVMGRVWADFDAAGLANYNASMEALAEDGLRLVDPQPGEGDAWRRVVRVSNRKALQGSTMDAALLDEIECHLAAFRAGSSSAHCDP